MAAEEGDMGSMSLENLSSIYSRMVDELGATLGLDDSLGSEGVIGDVAASPAAIPFANDSFSPAARGPPPAAFSPVDADVGQVSRRLSPLNRSPERATAARSPAPIAGSLEDLARQAAIPDIYDSVEPATPPARRPAAAPRSAEPEASRSPNDDVAARRAQLRALVGNVTLDESVSAPRSPAKPAPVTPAPRNMSPVQHTTPARAKQEPSSESYASRFLKAKQAKTPAARTVPGTGAKIVPAHVARTPASPEPAPVRQRRQAPATANRVVLAAERPPSRLVPKTASAAEGKRRSRTSAAGAATPPLRLSNLPPQSATPGYGRRREAGIESPRGVIPMRPLSPASDSDASFLGSPRVHGPANPLSAREVTEAAIAEEDRHAAEWASPASPAPRAQRETPVPSQKPDSLHRTPAVSHRTPAAASHRTPAAASHRTPAAASHRTPAPTPSPAPVRTAAAQSPALASSAHSVRTSNTSHSVPRARPLRSPQTGADDFSVSLARPQFFDCGESDVSSGHDARFVIPPAHAWTGPKGSDSPATVFMIEHDAESPRRRRSLTSQRRSQAHGARRRSASATPTPRRYIDDESDDDTRQTTPRPKREFGQPTPSSKAETRVRRMREYAERTRERIATRSRSQSASMRTPRRAARGQTLDEELASVELELAADVVASKTPKSALRWRAISPSSPDADATSAEAALRTPGTVSLRLWEPIDERRKKRASVVVWKLDECRTEAGRDAWHFWSSRLLERVLGAWFRGTVLRRRAEQHYRRALIRSSVALWRANMLRRCNNRALLAQALHKWNPALPHAPLVVLARPFDSWRAHVRTVARNRAVAGDVASSNAVRRLRDALCAWRERLAFRCDERARVERIARAAARGLATRALAAWHAKYRSNITVRWTKQVVSRQNAKLVATAWSEWRYLARLAAATRLVTERTVERKQREALVTWRRHAAVRGAERMVVFAHEQLTQRRVVAAWRKAMLDREAQECVADDIAERRDVTLVARVFYGWHVRMQIMDHVRQVNAKRARVAMAQAFVSWADHTRAARVDMPALFHRRRTLRRCFAAMRDAASLAVRERKENELADAMYASALLRRVMDAWLRKMDLARAGAFLAKRHGALVRVRMFSAWKERMVTVARLRDASAAVVALSQRHSAARFFHSWRQAVVDNVRVASFAERHAYHLARDVLARWRAVTRSRLAAYDHGLVVWDAYCDRLRRTAWIEWRYEARKNAAADALAAQKLRKRAVDMLHAWRRWAHSRKAVVAVAVRHRHYVRLAFLRAWRVRFHARNVERLADQVYVRAQQRRAVTAWLMYAAHRREAKALRVRADAHHRAVTARKVMGVLQTAVAIGKARQQRAAAADAWHARCVLARALRVWSARLDAVHAERAAATDVGRRVVLRTLAAAFAHWRKRAPEQARRRAVDALGQQLSAAVDARRVEQCWLDWRVRLRQKHREQYFVQVVASARHLTHRAFLRWRRKAAKRDALRQAAQSLAARVAEREQWDLVASVFAHWFGATYEARRLASLERRLAAVVAERALRVQRNAFYHWHRAAGTQERGEYLAAAVEQRRLARCLHHWVRTYRFREGIRTERRLLKATFAAWRQRARASGEKQALVVRMSEARATRARADIFIAWHRVVELRADARAAHDAVAARRRRRLLAGALHHWSRSARLERVGAAVADQMMRTRVMRTWVVWVSATRRVLGQMQLARLHAQRALQRRVVRAWQDSAVTSRQERRLAAMQAEMADEYHAAIVLRRTLRLWRDAARLSARPLGELMAGARHIRATYAAERQLDAMSTPAARFQSDATSAAAASSTSPSADPKVAEYIALLSEAAGISRTASRLMDPNAESPVPEARQRTPGRITYEEALRMRARSSSSARAAPAAAAPLGSRMRRSSDDMVGEDASDVARDISARLFDRITSEAREIAQERVRTTPGKHR